MTSPFMSTEPNQPTWYDIVDSPVGPAAADRG